MCKSQCLINILQLKDKVLVFVPTANKEQVCIIYTGKILKDEETLTQHSKLKNVFQKIINKNLEIADGHTVHLVIRNQARPTPAPAAATPTASSAPSSNPTPSSQPNPTNNPFAAMGGMGSPADILNNPDAMRSVMDNPITQQLLGNPEFMRTIIQSNPQFQALIEVRVFPGYLFCKFSDSKNYLIF